MPPILRRTIGKVILAFECAAIFAGVVLLISVGIARWQLVTLIGLLINLLIFPALAGLAVSLWMGFRWTIIEAGPEGLRMELRGLLFTRRWFVPRQRIRRIAWFVSLWVIGPHGLPLRRIDGTDQTEDRWILEILTRALAIPPPLQKTA